MSNQQSSQLVSLFEDGLYLLDLNKTRSFKLDLPFTLPAKTEPVCILQCRGLICLTLKGNNDLAIWNLTSKEFKRIPMVKPDQTTNLLGFGYDRVSDDYKIVTIIDHKTYIYTFKKSSWRESVPDTSQNCKFKNRSGTVVDHCMYWIADRSHIKNTRDDNTILCFDFVSEKYHEVNCPIYGKDKFSSWLGVLSGDFCLIDHYPFLDNDISVWRPERGDKKIKGWHSDPWINMTQNKEGFKSFDVLFACIARNDEVFIVLRGVKNGQDKIFVYDKRQAMFNEVPFGSSLKGFRCMTYVNSF